MEQKKRHKVVLQHTIQRNPIEQGGELVSINMFLSDKELDGLRNSMKRYKDVGTLALYHFTHSNYCSRHHRYLIWNTFEEGDINITVID